MKKAIAVLVLIGMAIGSMGKGGIPSIANVYADLERPLPAIPAE